MARTLKLFISTAFSLAAMALQVASAETWYWSPTHQSPNEKGTLFYFWNDAQNWTNSAAARGFPQAGDTSAGVLLVTVPTTCAATVPVTRCTKSVSRATSLSA